MIKKFKVQTQRIRKLASQRSLRSLQNDDHPRQATPTPAAAADNILQRASIAPRLGRHNQLRPNGRISEQGRPEGRKVRLYHSRCGIGRIGAGQSPLGEPPLEGASSRSWRDRDLVAADPHSMRLLSTALAV